MESTKILSDIQKGMAELCAQQPLLLPIADALHKQGGIAYLVGGAVRDLLLSLPIKDMDIEVHGMSLEELESVLKNYGPVSEVGKSFGVLKLHGTPFDFSLPRRDSAGRKPQVTVQDLSLEDALRRRDLTINALALDLYTKRLYDPFGGVSDLHAKKLRSPDHSFFAQDPLRFFRVMQFIGRFEMYPDEELTRVCSSMDISGVSRERIEMEFEKLLLKSKRPSLGIRWLAEIKRLHEVLPELDNMRGIEQEKKWHPEGDVFEHTMQSLDAAADEVSHLPAFSDREKLMIMYAVLCHDLGKVATTKVIDGRLRSFGHEVQGVAYARSLMRRITRNNELIDGGLMLVRYHHAPRTFIDQGAKPPAYKRLALKMYGKATLEQLAVVAQADVRGRNQRGHDPLPGCGEDLFLKKAHELGVAHGIEQPLLMGKDFLDVIEPGPELGKMVKQAYELQLEQLITDKEQLKKRVLLSQRAKGRKE